MRKPCFLAALVVALALGCSRPPTPSPPAGDSPGKVEPRPPEPPAPPLSAEIVRRSDGWEVPGLRSAHRYYLWSPDLRWVAFQTGVGLWAVSPDGTRENLLQEGDRSRELVDWWDGQLVFVDYGTEDGAAAIVVVRPGEEARVVTHLKGAFRRFDLVTAVAGPYLGIWDRSISSMRIDLRTGERKEMDAGPVPARCVPPLLSSSGKYAIIKNECEWDALRIYDLPEGTSRRSEEAAYPYGTVWAPAEDRWAAIAGPPGGGSADGGAFGASVDVGDTAMNVEHLKPPVSLKLRGGPWWSPDGKQLAVTAEVKPPSDGRYRDAVNEVWVITVTTGTWRKLAQVQFIHVQGWHPSGQNLVVWEIRSSAGILRAGSMDLKDGTIQWLPSKPPEEWDTTRVDDRLWVVRTPGGWADAAAYLNRPGMPPLPLGIAQPTYKDYLQFRPPYVSWVEESASSPRPGLVVIRRP